MLGDDDDDDLLLLIITKSWFQVNAYQGGLEPWIPDFGQTRMVESIFLSKTTFRFQTSIYFMAKIIGFLLGTYFFFFFMYFLYIWWIPVRR